VAVERHGSLASETLGRAWRAQSDRNRRTR
jgi:hypothetical protein